MKVKTVFGYGDFCFTVRRTSTSFAIKADKLRGSGGTANILGKLHALPFMVSFQPRGSHGVTAAALFR